MARPVAGREDFDREVGRQIAEVVRHRVVREPPGGDRVGAAHVLAREAEPGVGTEDVSQPGFLTKAKRSATT